MKLHKNDKLLFIGDSITDCGRSHPVGRGVRGWAMDMSHRCMPCYGLFIPN